MKRYISSGNSATPSNGIKFYHYDRRKFNVGDTLVGKFHTCPYPQVLKIYSEKNPQISDFQDVLYLYDTQFDSMLETCKYCYEVKPDCIEKRYLDAIKGEEQENLINRALPDYSEDVINKINMPNWDISV